MTDNKGEEYTGGLQSTEAGQPLPEGSTEPAEQTPQFVTKADLESVVARLEQSFSRLAQSQADKSVAGLRKSVEKRLAEFTEFAKEAGVPQQIIDAEQARIWAEALDEHRSGSSGEPVAQQDIEAVNEWIGDIAEELGVAPLRPKDPEFVSVNFNDPNPASFKVQYEKAIRAKAARRSGGQVQPQQNAPSAPPAARTPMTGTGQPSGNPTLEQMTQQLSALQRKVNRTPADWNAMRELESKITAQLRS